MGDESFAEISNIIIGTVNIYFVFDCIYLNYVYKYIYIKSTI